MVFWPRRGIKDVILLIANTILSHSSRQRIIKPSKHRHNLSTSTRHLGLDDGLLETILEASRQVLQVAHASSASSLSALSLDGPVVVAQLGGRVAALGASLLLVVEGAVAAAAAQSVRLGVAFTEAGRTLGLHSDGGG
jgi:hypothetical protein